MSALKTQNDLQIQILSTLGCMSKALNDLVDASTTTVDPSAAFAMLFDNLSAQITASIDAQTADLNDVTVTIDGQPIEVNGTVTVDSITNAVTVDWDRAAIQAAFENLEVNTTGLETFLANNTLTVTLDGEELNVNFDEVTTLLEEIRDLPKTELLDGYCYETSVGSGIFRDAYAVFAEDGTFSEYRDRLTHTAIPTASVTECPQITVNSDTVNIGKERIRGSGNLTITQPYRSFSITALSDDVTIDGQAIPNGLTEGIGTNENEVFTQDTVITGTDYFVTVTRNI